MSLADQLALKLKGELSPSCEPSWSFDGICKGCGCNESECQCEKEVTLCPEKHHLVFRKEKRKGKVVTLVGEFFCEEQTMKEVVATLKKTLGCGGSFKEGFVEIQGEQEEKIRLCLERLWYRFKHKK